MEGWLYLIRSNRFGLQYSQKRYFVLEDNCLNCFKSVPISKKEGPIRTAAIDTCIRVTDNGREHSLKGWTIVNRQAVWTPLVEDA